MKLRLPLLMLAGMVAGAAAFAMPGSMKRAGNAAPGAEPRSSLALDRSQFVKICVGNRLASYDDDRLHVSVVAERVCNACGSERRSGRSIAPAATQRTSSLAHSDQRSCNQIAELAVVERREGRRRIYQECPLEAGLTCPQPSTR